MTASIEVWPVLLAANSAQCQYAETMLSSEQRECATRFASDEQRGRYLLTHAVLRTLVAHYTGKPAHSIRFLVGQHGKPALPHSSLQFNLAHSEAYAAYAFSRDCEVGIDIELLRPQPDRETLLRRFFAPQEYGGRASSPSDEEFLSLWTRKEACLKALGLGLSSLDRVLTSGQTASTADGKRLQLHAFRFDGVIGTVACLDLQSRLAVHPCTPASVLLRDSAER